MFRRSSKPKEPIGPVKLSDGTLVEPINADEEKFVAACHHYASTIFTHLGEKPNGQGAYEPTQIDRAIQAYQEEPHLAEKLKMNQQYYRFALGGAWGEYLNATYGMGWRVLHDQHGSEMCVFSPENEVKVFPFQSVDRCIEEGTREGIQERTAAVAALFASGLAG